MTYDDKFLSHHGIKGMKWGVTRTPEQLGHIRKKRDRDYDIQINEELAEHRSGLFGRKVTYEKTGRYSVTGIANQYDTPYRQTEYSSKVVDEKDLEAAIKSASDFIRHANILAKSEHDAYAEIVKGKEYLGDARFDLAYESGKEAGIKLARKRGFKESKYRGHGYVRDD